MFHTIGIIGLGHMGASLALAIREAKICDKLVGFDREEKVVRYCQAESVVDQIAPLEAIAKEAELIILAVPPHYVAEVTELLKPHLSDNTVLTDIASVKVPVLHYLQQPGNENLPFIPGHPIAGGTYPGPQHARGDIFMRKLVMLTPPMGIAIDDLALQKTRLFWESLDMQVELMPAEFHDQLYGYVSHLPHLIAYAASVVLADEEPEESYKDRLFRFTRLGNSHPPLWTDIIFNNHAHVLGALKNYIAMIGHIRGELKEGAQQLEEDSPAPHEECSIAAQLLFPRIAASCLIATVSMLEKQSGQRLARYSGAGFADVASPAAEEPESEMEQISHHYAAMAELLLRFEKQLDMLAIAIESNQPKQLTDQLHSMKQAHLELRAKVTDQ